MLDRTSGQSEFKSQGEYGHTFLPNQVLVFWTQALDFTYLVSHVGVVHDCYMVYRRSLWMCTVWVMRASEAMLVGPASCQSIFESWLAVSYSLSSLLSCYLWGPSHVSGDRGTADLALPPSLSFSLSSPSLPPSTVSYIIMNPAKACTRAIHRMHQSFAHYWKKHKRTLDIGHRGLGDSHHATEKMMPSATENTIASLKRAGAHVSGSLIHCL